MYTHEIGKIDAAVGSESRAFGQPAVEGHFPNVDSFQNGPLWNNGVFHQ